jgi:ribonuclease HI
LPTATQTEPVASAATLVRRFRELCEARGLARAHRLPLDPTLDEELDSIEEQLLERLSLPAQPAGSKAPSATPSSPAAAATAPPRTSLAASIYTDGAAEGNPGPGGYAALIRIAGQPDREVYGGDPHTTNNKMELTAAIVGLRAAIDAGATSMTVISDSEYLIKGMTRWLSGWVAKNWLTAEKQPVKNRELWEQLAELAKSRAIEWNWVRGHAGHPENQRCDDLATAAARKAAREGR